MDCTRVNTCCAISNAFWLLVKSVTPSTTSMSSKFIRRSSKAILKDSPASYCASIRFCLPPISARTSESLSIPVAKSVTTPAGGSSPASRAFLSSTSTFKTLESGVPVKAVVVVMPKTLSPLSVIRIRLESPWSSAVTRLSASNPICTKREP